MYASSLTGTLYIGLEYDCYNFNLASTWSLLIFNKNLYLY